MVALNKETGEVVWICKGIGDMLGYSSPTLFEYKGIRQIATMTHCAVIGVNAHTGELLWRHEHNTPYNTNIVDPIFHDGCVFITSWTTGSKLLRLDLKGKKVSVERVWESKDMDNEHGAVVLLDGYLYGGFSTLDEESPWACIEWATGKRTWADRGIGIGTLVYADGMLYGLNHRRTVALIRATPRAFELVSQFSLPEAGEGPTWAHPVICWGRLYIRHSDFLYCYDIKAK